MTAKEIIKAVSDRIASLTMFGGPISVLMPLSSVSRHC